MKVIYSNYEPCYKIYKISENISNKYYIGKTKRPIDERIQFHMIGDLKCDLFFGGVGWNNCICEIIDYANNSEELSEKEIMWIKKHLNHPDMLNVQFNRPKMDDVEIDTSESKNMTVVRIWDEDENNYILSIVE